MKPEPVPLGTCCTFMLKMSRCAASDVMWTTDGATRLYRLMVVFSISIKSPRGVGSRGWASALLGVGFDRHDGQNVPDGANRHQSSRARTNTSTSGQR